jgi:hypothetical protein
LFGISPNKLYSRNNKIAFTYLLKIIVKYGSPSGGRGNPLNCAGYNSILFTKYRRGAKYNVSLGQRALPLLNYIALTGLLST